MNTLFDDPPQATAEKITLRPYQNDCLAAIEAAKDRGVRRALIVLPTGAGKTTVFSELIRRSNRPGFSALLLAHHSELLDQGAERIKAMNPTIGVGIESGDFRARYTDRVVVAGVQTLGRENCTRLLHFMPSLVITDEAHHSPADSYCIIYRRIGVFDEAWNGLHLGVTATPRRMDNRPVHGSEDAIYQELVYQYTLRDAIKDRYLCDVRGYRVAGGADLGAVKTTAGDYNLGQLQAAMNTTSENELAFKSWAEIAKERPTIVFCSGVEHAKDVATVFMVHGVKAVSVDGAMRKEDRERAINDFKGGRVQVLCNMDIATEGFDYPPVSCVLMLRPTQSWTLYQQMVGRGLRQSENKEDCIVIDVVGIAPNKDAPKRESIKKPVGLSSLCELPDIDLEGHTLMEAVEAFDELTDAQRAAIFKRPTNFSGLSATLTEIDILRELAIPDEIKGSTHFAWLKVGEMDYVLRCGPGPSGERFAHLKADALGIYRLRLRHSREECDYFMGELRGDTPQAMKGADAKVREIWDDVYRFADTRCKWRGDSPTEKQLYLLRKLGAKQATIEALTKGTASALIDKLRREQSGVRVSA